jgi:hypothetical protein
VDIGTFIHGVRKQLHQMQSILHGEICLSVLLLECKVAKHSLLMDMPFWLTQAKLYRHTNWSIDVERQRLMIRMLILCLSHMILGGGHTYLIEGYPWGSE